ncbi:DivIVA domain-containing protein [Asanoa sp. NPDC049573]|uniref:DivIVA domain-containing protein n=1 Tax=Asanoa sp. NPDC049573 TaxID=3155396 RepID=UPI0034268A0B
MADFDVSLRGYDRATVDALVRAVEAAGSDRARIEAAVKRIGPPVVVLRGYDRMQVDAWLARRQGVVADAPRLLIVLRGYRITETDALLATVNAALEGDDPFRRAAALRAIHEARLPVSFRGYDRGMVDSYLERAARDLGSGQVG